jgi:hypothetical protein
MVVFLKENDKILICVDLTKLNKAVCKERQILPSVEETLAQIGGQDILKGQAFGR